MITCSFKDLQVIHSKLERIMITLQPSARSLFKEVTSQTILSIIKDYVEAICLEIAESKTLQDHSAQLEGNMYQKIELDLQKQEQINRMLIKKQLEFKEYQKCLEEELKTEKTNAKKLQSRLEKYNQKIVNKDLEIHHLTNEKKVLGKDKKIRDVITMDTPFKDQKMLDGFKAIAKDIFPVSKPSHRRRQSDDTCKKPSTGSTKRRMSVSKR